MNIDALNKALEDVLILMQKLIERLDSLQEKGGPGSGPKPHSGHDTPPHEHDKPRSGVRPAAINPSRHEIEYHEQPSSDSRPRSGVRPERKPKPVV